MDVCAGCDQQLGDVLVAMRASLHQGRVFEPAASPIQPIVNREDPRIINTYLCSISYNLVL